MLYPIKKSFAIHEIKRDEHILYFEEYGKKEGIANVYFYMVDLEVAVQNGKKAYLIVEFTELFLDQRGAGKSISKRL